jgi:hypothetical protein
MSDKRSSVAVTGRGARSRFIPVFEPGTNWLLFKYDPERKLIEIQRQKRKTLIDLTQLGDDGGLTDNPKI